MRLAELQNTTEFRAVNIIQENCGEILNTYNQTHKVLWRGLHTSMPSIFVSNTPITRQPKGTPDELHKIINDKLIAAGFEATRDNSIFCYSEKLHVRRYGSPWIVFPFNGFEFTYSKYHDLTMQFDTDLDVDVDNMDDLYQQPTDDFIKEHQFRNDNLPFAMQESVEILIYGKYIAVRYTPNNVTDVLSKVLKFSL